MNGLDILYFTILSGLAGASAHLKLYGATVYFTLIAFGYLIDKVF